MVVRKVPFEKSLMLRVSFALGFTAFLALSACGADPCQDVADKVTSCLQSINCASKPAAERAQCEAAKAAASQNSMANVNVACTGNQRLAAQACLLKGISAPSCSCL